MAKEKRNVEAILRYVIMSPARIWWRMLAAHARRTAGYLRIGLILPTLRACDGAKPISTAYARMRRGKIKMKLTRASSYNVVKSARKSIWRRR